jgi:hypothetical protein
MRSFTDTEVIAHMNSKYQDAKTAQKEGPGTHRNIGDAGQIASEWIRWRREAIRRGLIGEK